MVDRPFEIIHAREGRAVRRRQAANRHDAEFRGDPVAVVGLDQPAIGVLVEGRRGDAGVEHDLAAQVEAIGDVVGVSEDFRLRRIFLRPVPFLVQLFGEREGVLHALDIAAGAGIAIPVPGSADAAAGLKDPRVETEAAQPVQHVQAGKACADHDRVENPRFGSACCCTRLSHACPFPLFLVAFPLTRLGRAHAGRQARGAPRYEWHLCCAGHLTPTTAEVSATGRSLQTYQLAVPFMVGWPSEFAIHSSMPALLSLALIENSPPSNNGCTPR